MRLLILLLCVASSLAIQWRLAPLYKHANDVRVDGNYLIMLKENSDVDGVIKNLRESFFDFLGGRVVDKFSALGAFSAQLSDAALSLVRRHQLVEFVEEDSIMYAMEVESWGLDRIDQDDLPLNDDYYPAYTGYGVNIYVIDTGLNIYHDDFDGRAWVGFDAVYNPKRPQRTPNGPVFRPYSQFAVLLSMLTTPRWRATLSAWYIGGYGSSEVTSGQTLKTLLTQYLTAGNMYGIDCHGHGSHCAGTAAGRKYGVAKEATVFGVRVLGCRGAGTVGNIAGGCNFVAEYHIKPAIASMSLGGAPSRFTDYVVRRMASREVMTVVAAGNSNIDACNASPAREKSAVCVGAIDSSDTRAYFSNYGDCVDIYAPGVGITSAWKDGDEIYTASGTSMACPHVAGAAALAYQEFPNHTTGQVRSHLFNLAVKGRVHDDMGAEYNRLLRVRSA